MAKKRDAEELWVCGSRWAVSMSHDTIMHDGRMCHGLTDKHNRTVHISLDTPDLFSVVYHELKHSIFETVTNGHPEDEESCVQADECGFISVLRDPRNKWFRSLVRNEVSP